MCKKKTLRVTRRPNFSTSHSLNCCGKDGIHHFTLVHEGARTVHTAHNVRHARLVAPKGRQVRRVGLRVLGKGTDATRVLLGALFGQETQTSRAGRFKLAMRPV